MYSARDRGLSSGMPSLGHVHAANFRPTAAPPATAWARNEIPVQVERRKARPSQRRRRFASIRTWRPVRTVTAAPVATVAAATEATAIITATTADARTVRRPVMQVMTSHAHPVT